jgi:site-specific DNA recombinase
MIRHASDVLMPLRAAVYARYSSDAQSEQSIEDQVRVCRARAEREGWAVVEVYADYAISGASAGTAAFPAAAGRHALRPLRDRARRGAGPHQPRPGTHRGLSQADQLRRRARGHAWPRAHISELHIGLKGTMSALFLKDLAQKTHRGLEGRVRRRRQRRRAELRLPHPTRLCGQMARRSLASWRWCRRRRPSCGGSFRATPMAYRRVPSPRCSMRRWCPVPGAAAGPPRWCWAAPPERPGLLRNHLYVGERVWNRQRFSKDPSTGRRVARPNPRQVWITTHVPELAIIDAELWQAVQVRLRRTSLG